MIAGILAVLGFFAGVIGLSILLVYLGCELTDDRRRRLRNYGS